MVNPNPLQITPYLDRASSEELKKAASIWGGHEKLVKAQCIRLINEGLANPEKVREVVNSLEPYERNALFLAKMSGGTIKVSTLGLGIIATGVALPRSNDTDQIKNIAYSLIAKCLFLPSNDRRFFSATVDEKTALFSDYRLLDSVDSLVFQPLNLTPVHESVTSTFRQPAVVSLELIGILQSIDNLGGLKMTRTGDLRVNDVKKLARLIKWGDSKNNFDGWEFPSPILALITVLYDADWLGLNQTGDSIELSKPIEEFASCSYREQIIPLLRNFMGLKNWQEWSLRYWSDPNIYVEARVIFFLVLKSLPVDTGVFWSLDELDQGLYDRISRYFSLNLGTSPRLFLIYKNAQKSGTLDKLRLDWLQNERQFFEKMLTTWLYFLGIVEIDSPKGQPLYFRLTPLGKQILDPGFDSENLSANSAQASWLVQPNFEIVVYLSATDSKGLAFLERHAERIKVEQHVAVYQLTRESVYRSLEKGSSLTDLLEGLRKGCSIPLPQNVVVDLNSWGRLREEISLYPCTKLLEFPNEKARQDTVAKEKLQGKCIGDRFFLLASGQSPSKTSIETTIDYTKPLPRCLSATEGGKITVTTKADFLLPDYLDRWADRQSETVWQLTSESVQQAVRSGGNINDLLDTLKNRLIAAMPKYLGVALKGWAGQYKKVELAQVLVLHCPDAEVFDLVTKHEQFKNYWVGILGYGFLLINKSEVKPLQQKLALLGLTITDDLKVDK
ncbi:MAG: hypothetical protein N5P05_003078 [Chroococcopsis gigantea SAG 12.99]|jgi:hypothetical protein|nr:helicase-associated domain-containing protein [Chlorogloea purpurea SAG 13.99]MDV3001472.1 hypothetical protein [Chroococcopsis gigantea SAG 12.99]